MTITSMIGLRRCLLVAVLLAAAPAPGAEKLVIDAELDADVLSVVHNIDAFLFTTTMNFSADVPGDLARRFVADPLKNHLSVTMLVKINGKLAGFATEQETIGTDPASGQPFAESAWLITLNYPGASGVLAVKQRENAAPVFGLVKRVMDNPAGPWEDRFQSFLSTSGTHRVAIATNDLAPYLGGRFEEYNIVNPADYAKYKRFRGGIQFVIYPKE